MKFLPSENLSDEQIKSGLNLVVKDGLAAEAMATLTGGSFLIALALKFNASNFQIGLMAAIPTIANIFQLVAIYLVYKFANRRAIAVYSSFFSRLPLLLIAPLPFIFPAHLVLNILIFLLFFHHFFGAISGTSWNSWMKDLVPEKMLGTYFSHRSRLIQILSVALSFICAYALDFVKLRLPAFETNTYSIMFLVGGLSGLYGVYVLSKTPEPKIEPIKKNILHLFKNPLKTVNFRNLIIFNACWAFAINLAAPFFTVYLLKMLHLKLSYIVALTILSQLTNILFIRIWGRYSDKYSNKTIIKICAPIYLSCILAWTFTTMPDKHMLTIPLLIVIHIFSGIAVSGINLAIGNIGIKLAPKKEAIVFLSIRSMINAFFGALAPIIGGLFADYFTTCQLTWNMEWKSPKGEMLIHTLDLQQWDFFFVLAFILGLFALYRLSFLKEEGEVHKKIMMTDLVAELKANIRNSGSTITGALSMVYFPVSLFWSFMRNKHKTKPERKIGN